MVGCRNSFPEACAELAGPDTPHSPRSFRNPSGLVRGVPRGRALHADLGLEEPTWQRAFVAGLVPEPSSALLGLCGAFYFVMRRKRELTA